MIFILIGVWKVSPMIYSGHRSKSVILCHRSFGVIGWRLCMPPLLGSSRMTRFTMIISSLETYFNTLFLSSHIEMEYIPLSKPTFLPSQPARSLRRRGRHEDKRCESNHNCEKTL